MYFYLVDLINRNELEVLKAALYVHVKGKCDGTQLAIISEEFIDDPNVVEKSRGELQAILDGWINAENLNPSRDIDGNELLQDKINLGVYVTE